MYDLNDIIVYVLSVRIWRHLIMSMFWSYCWFSIYFIIFIINIVIYTIIYIVHLYSTILWLLKSMNRLSGLGLWSNVVNANIMNEYIYTYIWERKTQRERKRYSCIHGSNAYPWIYIYINIYDIYIYALK